VCVCVCVCVRVLPGFLRGMEAFYFEIENRSDILNPTANTADQNNCTLIGVKTQISYSSIWK